MSLPIGKVPKEILEKYVLKFTGESSENVVLGPKFGIDFAVIKLDGRYMIVASDPVTGAEKEVGWYAVNVSANDVATSGSRPTYLESVILLPQGSKTEDVMNMSIQIHRAAKELGISVIGGHTELTLGLRRAIVVTTTFGFTERYITAADAREGDFILMTKTAGLEGTSILADAFKEKLYRLGENVISNASKMARGISVVDEATRAFKIGFVHAMHDATEGGVIGGVYEMGVASNLGFVIEVKDIPIALETKTICRALDLDPLKLISSGVLLLAVEPSKVDGLCADLRKIGVRVSIIGYFTRGKRIVIEDGSEKFIEESIIDELWKVLS
ncbi:MAG: AIR synthase family protein [Candidatus Methylarchaceae archaeon HK01M]|nr:AIR synthase family protein [Candidatus Methylarchaceae archaeon HK01M]